jgi:hypothetical protein
MKRNKPHGRLHEAKSQDAREGGGPVPTPGLRRFLYLTAGVVGAAIMIVEILGAKILAPYVGTSHFVWTAQIGVTLAALACGYYLGGRFADAPSSLSGLYFAVFAAAAWLALTVVFLKPIAYAFIRLPLAFASLVSSTLLYFAPLALLAMAGPFLLRQITPSISEVGRTAGRLSALNTVGSFIGTATIGYFLIPLVPSSMIMVGTAAFLALLSLVYFFRWGWKFGRGRAFFVLMILSSLGVLGASIDAKASESQDLSSLQVLETRESAFGLLQVARIRQTSQLYFINDYLIQNTYDVAAGKSVSSFTYLLEGLAEAYAPRLERALCIGMGIGIVPRELARKGVEIDTVEINPQIAPLARRYFDLDTSQFHLHIGDGRRFLETTDAVYDAVILDAFIGDSSPAHLMTAEAFAAVKRVLRSDGVVIVNSFADLADPEDFYATSLYRTMESVFTSVRVHGSPSGNALFVASRRPDLAFIRPPDLSAVHGSVRPEVEAAYRFSWTPAQSGGIVLTDDFNPLEFRDAPKREALRRMLALSLKDI